MSRALTLSVLAAAAATGHLDAQFTVEIEYASSLATDAVEAELEIVPDRLSAAPFDFADYVRVVEEQYNADGGFDTIGDVRRELRNDSIIVSGFEFDFDARTEVTFVGPASPPSDGSDTLRYCTTTNAVSSSGTTTVTTSLLRTVVRTWEAGRLVQSIQTESGSGEQPPLTTDYVYDDASGAQVARIRRREGRVVDSLSIGYDAEGLRVSDSLFVGDDLRATAYTYDPEDRLASSLESLSGSITTQALSRFLRDAEGDVDTAEMYWGTAVDLAAGPDYVNVRSEADQAQPPAAVQFFLVEDGEDTLTRTTYFFRLGTDTASSVAPVAPPSIEIALANPALAGSPLRLGTAEGRELRAYLVSLDGRRRRLAVGADGSAVFPEVTPGIYVVAVEAAGYAPTARVVAVVR